MAVIEVKNLKKYYKQVKAVDDISFNIEQGEIFGFLGPNGAGKTTTIRCMMDFIHPNSGQISILSKDSQKDTVALKQDVGYLPAVMQFYNHWTGSDHIKIIEKLRHGSGETNQYIKMLNFNPKLEVKSLSTGNRQKLGIILALINQPKVIILDEPTVGLDPLLQNVIYEILRDLASKGSTIFMSSHNLHEVEEICGRVGIIKQGKLIAVETISDLKRKRIYTVRVDFEGEFNPADFSVNGTKIKEQKDHEILLIVKGDINNLIQKVARHQLKSLEIVQAPLDEIFLEYYAKE